MLDDPQLRTYQGVAEAYATGESLHLLLNDHWIEDTRIPPRGLTPDVETDPVGDRYLLQDDGTWPHFDVVDYAFDGVADLADADGGTLDVTARLLYVINTPEYIDFLAAENVTNDAGNDVQMLFDAAGGAPPMVMAVQTLSIPVSLGTGSSSGGSSTGPGSGTDGNTTTGPVDPTVGPTTGATDPTGDGSSSSTAGSDDGGGGGGCGCTSGDDGGQAWLLVGLVGLARRRRRRCA